MKNKKILIGISSFLFIVLFYFLYSSSKSQIEKNIASLNGYQPPQGTYFYGLETNFNKVSCEGFLQYTCTIEDINVKIKGTKNPILKIEKAYVKDINLFKNKDTELNIDLKNVEPKGQLQDIIYPQSLTYNDSKEIAKDIYKNLFPLNLSLYVKIHKYMNKEGINSGKGSIKITAEDNAFYFAGGADIETIGTKDRYSVVIDKNGTLIRDKNISGKKLAEYKMNQHYYTLISKANFEFKNKKVFNTFYKMYQLNMKEYPYKRKGINENILGISSEEILSFDKFKEEFLNRMKEYQQANENKIGKESSSFLMDMINGSKNDIKFSMKLKKYITLEEYLVLSGLTKDNEKIIETYFDTKTETK